MIRDSVCYLVRESPAAHGVFDPPAETQRMVFCAEKSVSNAEFYRALSNGLHPRLILTLADPAEYQDEKICIYGIKRYRVVRSYITAANAVELTLEEATADA